MEWIERLEAGHIFRNQQVSGSSPEGGSTKSILYRLARHRVGFKGVQFAGVSEPRFFLQQLIQRFNGNADALRHRFDVVLAAVPRQNSSSVSIDAGSQTKESLPS